MDQDWVLGAIAEVMPIAVSTGLFDSLCDVQKLQGSINASGQLNNIWITQIAGITCMDAPPTDTRVSATEMRELADILSSAPRHVLLSGYYPTIVTAWRAVITKADGITTVFYDIMGAEADSQAQMTRLEVKLTTQ